MANYNEHKCLTCGKIFEYCRRCAITPVVYKAEGFCSEECSHVFNTLSKHGCNLATAEETLKALEALNIEGNAFTPSIQAHIDALKAEVEPTPVVEEVEVKSTVEQSNKKKKKW